MTKTLSLEAAAFAELVTQWPAEKLIDHYASAYTSNRYGNHDEEMQILKAELLSRVRQDDMR